MSMTKSSATLFSVNVMDSRGCTQTRHMNNKHSSGITVKLLSQNVLLTLLKVADEPLQNSKTNQSFYQNNISGHVMLTDILSMTWLTSKHQWIFLSEQYVRPSHDNGYLINDLIGIEAPVKIRRTVDFMPNINISNSHEQPAKQRWSENVAHECNVTTITRLHRKWKTTPTKFRGL